MLPRNHPDRIQIAFDDPRLVANAGLLLPVTLAQHLGLREVVDSHVDLGDAPGRANPGDKLLTLVASALAGGDFIDDADVLRTGGTAGAIGCVVKAPSTLGTFLRSFRWGHVRQLDRVSRELLSRAWAAGTGPGEGPLTIDLDSTMCETYGLAKEGPGQHRSGRRPLPAGDRGSGAPCWGQGTTHGAGRQRLLCPRPGRRLPRDGCPPARSAIVFPCILSRRPRPSAAAQDRHRPPQRQPKAATGPIYRNRARTVASHGPHPLF